MIHCATKYQNNWNEVKTSFLDIYPKDRSLPSLISELSSVTRQSRETITELFLRVEGIVAKLEVMKPAGKEVYNDIFVSIIVNALPKDFAYVLADADMKKPLSVYKKALKYVVSHPNIQLNDAAIRKKNKVIPVNAVSISTVTQESTGYRLRQINITSIVRDVVEIITILNNVELLSVSDIISGVILLGNAQLIYSHGRDPR